MKDCYFHIVTNGNIQISNLPQNMHAYADKCKSGYSRINSYILHKDICQIKEINGYDYIYICSYDNTITRKILQHYFDALKDLNLIYVNKLKDIENNANSDLRRLQHNVTDYNAAIRDDFSDLISPDEIQQDWQNIVSNVELIVKNNSRKAALTLLKTYKNSTLIKSELTVYDLIKNPNPHLELYPHFIHKVVKLSFQPYFLEFLENDIHLFWSDCLEKVQIDYPSISVVLGHIWNNAIKYAKPSSSINIDFDSSLNDVTVSIKMLSLAIEEREKNDLFKLGYSGYWAKQINKEGHGIGMYYIKMLVEMNHGRFSFHSNSPRQFVNSIPYTWNTFKLTLPKSK